MRNRNRINRICRKFKSLWLKNPDMRFHQLIQTFMYNDRDYKIISLSGFPPHTFDYYHKEDDDTEYRIITYQSTTKNKIKKLKRFISTFENTLKNLNDKDISGKLNDDDRWHRAAINSQLNSWNEELEVLNGQ